MTVDKPSGDYRGAAVAGYALIFLIFGVLGGWAAVAHIDGAVIASGTVSVQSKRQWSSTLRVASSARSACVMVRW